MAEVSILIPVYNSVNYLETCLDSVRNQSFGDFEVIMVDDGSHDGSEKICDQYAELDSRFKVFHQENRGAGAARSAAIEHALQNDTEYIVWVDADDMIHRDYLKILYGSIRSHPDVKIVQCDYTKEIHELSGPDRGMHQKAEEFDSEAILYHLVGGRYSVDFSVLWNKIYKKEIFTNIRVYADANITGRVNDDVNLLWRVYIEAGKSLWISSCLYYYRQVPGSLQHRKLGKIQLEILYLWIILYQYALSHGMEKFADHISERTLFTLAVQMMGRPKTEYEDYAQFRKDAKAAFKDVKAVMDIRCKRIDLKVLRWASAISFSAFRAYGRCYRKLKHRDQPNFVLVRQRGR